LARRVLEARPAPRGPASGDPRSRQAPGRPERFTPRVPSNMLTGSSRSTRFAAAAGRIVHRSGPAPPRLHCGGMSTLPAAIRPGESPTRAPVEGTGPGQSSRERRLGAIPLGQMAGRAQHEPQNAGGGGIRQLQGAIDSTLLRARTRWRARRPGSGRGQGRRTSKPFPTLRPPGVRQDLASDINGIRRIPELRARARDVPARACSARNSCPSDPGMWM